MKKVRIELLPGVREKRYTFFDSVEALYDDMAFGRAAEEISGKKAYDCFEIVLRDDDFLEVEWMGCENVFEEDATWYSLSFVRFCKATGTKNSSGIRVEPHFGWILESDLVFCDSIDSTCKKILLKNPEDARLDFPSIFKDAEIDDTETATKPTGEG